MENWLEGLNSWVTTYFFLFSASYLQVISDPDLGLEDKSSTVPLCPHTAPRL
jgi:hypothetical protein